MDKQSTIKHLLENPTWPKGLETKTRYERVDDENNSHIAVTLGDDGDAYVSIGRHCARFCTLQGGGQSHRTRAALLILAEAIRLDNAEKLRR